jgi:hypothetical protein
MKKRREASFSSVRGSSVSPGAGFGKGGSAGALERQKERIKGLGENRGVNVLDRIHTGMGCQASAHVVASMK